MDSGRYRQSRYLIEFNQNIVTPGCFQQYMFLLTPYVYCSNPSGFIKEFGDDDYNISMISYNSIIHETTHLIQDYSLGSEMVRDILYDEICGLVLSYIKNQTSNFQTITFPLEDQLKHTPVLGNLYDVYTNWYSELFKDAVSLTLIYKNGDEQNFSLTTDELLEAYAAARSYHHMTSFIHPFPELNYAYFNYNMDVKYKKTWDIYRLYCSFERKDFTGSKKTPDLQLDINSFLLICDIALHIPPLTFNNPIEQCDLPEYQIPCMRFLQALKTVQKNKGFPDAVDGTDFYITLYNFISKDNKWPDFNQVQDMWINFLNYRMSHFGLMISDLYRFYVAHYKLQKSNAIIFGGLPDVLCSYRIPVLLRYFNEEGSTLEWVQFDDSPFLFSKSDEVNSLLFDPYKIMTRYYNFWTLSSLKKAVHENEPNSGSSIPLIYLREIFCRSISKEFWHAVLKNSYFRCPLIDLNCRDKLEICLHIKNLANLPCRCCLRSWLFDYKINPHLIEWRLK